jgi:lipopolysaccharide exporter
MASTHEEDTLVESEPHEVRVGVAKVARGSRHTAISQALAQVVRFATNVVLARLLTPDDFGVVAIALVVGLLLDQLKDLGTGSAIIQRERLTAVLLNSVFFLNMGMGALLAGAMYFGAGPVAVALGNSDSRPAIQALAGVTFITSLSQIHHALLRRDLRYGVIAVITSVNALTTAVVSIVAAFMGMNYWALVLGIAVGSIVDCLMVWTYDRWRPRWAVDLASIRSIWRYSWHLFLTNLLFLFFNQIDKVIVSHFLGLRDLGTYAVAQRTVTGPATSVGSVVNEVSFPAFARRQNDHAALRNGYLRASRAVALITFPAMCGLAVLATPLVAVVFGPDWTGLVPVIWLLAPVGAIQAVTNSSSQLLLAKGRTDWSYRWGLVYCVVLTVGELIGVRWGLAGVAGAYAVGVLILTPFGLMLAFHHIEFRLRDYVRDLLPYVWLTAAMCVTAYAASALVRAGGGAAVLQAGAGIVIGAATYGGLLMLSRPVGLQDLKVALHRGNA